MEEYGDGDSGSDFNSISDISSLGSFGDQYAVKKKTDGTKTKRKSVVSVETGLPVEKKRKSTIKKKKKEGDGAGEAAAKAEQKTSKKTKQTQLKELNERVLGLDIDDEYVPQQLTPSAINPQTFQPQPSPLSYTAEASPMQVNTTNTFFPNSPMRVPSPKMNPLGSNRVSPFPGENHVPQQAEYSIAGGYSTVQQQYVPPTSYVPAPAYVPAPMMVVQQPPVYVVPSVQQSFVPAYAPAAAPSLAPAYDSTNTLKSAESSRHSSINNDSQNGHTAVIPSAVSERRKAAAAARAAKQQAKSAKRIPDEVVEFSGAETSPEIAAKSRKHISKQQIPASIPETAVTSPPTPSTSVSAMSNGVDASRKAFEPLKLVISSSAASPSAAAAVSPLSSSASQPRSKNSRGKKVSIAADDQSSSSGHSDDSAERRRRKKGEDKKKSNAEKDSTKQRELDVEKAKADEKDRERREKISKREELNSRESTPPSIIRLPAEAVSAKAPSFARKSADQAFCKLIKSPTYLNAIKIAHSEVPKVLCASADSTVQIYNITDGEQLASLVGHTDRVISLAVSNPFMYADKNAAGGKPTLKTLVASGSRDEQLRIWDMDSAKCLHSIHAHKSPIWAVAIAVRPNGDVIVVSTASDGSMRSWNGKTGKKINNFKGHTDKILSVFIMNPLGENPLILSAGADKKIRVWELLTGAHIRMLEGHEDEINCVVAGSFSGISSLVPISNIDDDGKNHTDVAGLDSSKSTVIVSASKDLTVRVWDFRSGHLLFELLGHSACIYEVAIMRAKETPLSKGKGSNIIPPGTPIIISCSEDATIKLWNLVTGKMVKSLKYHSVSVRGIDCATVLPQSSDPSSGISLIASCGWDKTIQFHELGEALYSKTDSACTIA